MAGVEGFEPTTYGFGDRVKSLKSLAAVGAFDSETVPASAYRALRERCEAAEEALRQINAIREQRVVRGPRWPQLDLSAAEERVLAALVDNPGVVSYAYLVREACHRYDDVDNPRHIMMVRISRLRDKVWRHGVVILNHKEIGYQIPAASRAVLVKLQAYNPKEKMR